MATPEVKLVEGELSQTVSQGDSASPEDGASSSSKTIPDDAASSRNSLPDHAAGDSNTSSNSQKSRGPASSQLEEKDNGDDRVYLDVFV